VDESDTAYFFQTSDGGTAAVRGERLEWLQTEARRRGVTVEEVWRVMLGQGGDRIWRILEND
jgi:hypothetical protein